MPSKRRRLGVALLLDGGLGAGGLGAEVDGLRRALGDPGLGRIPPHITLVPPVNVAAAALPTALAVVRAAAAAQPGPLRLTVGAVSSFVPDNPVVYLAVGGELAALRRLRDGVFRPPLERKLSWPWVPHVTLADGIAAELIAPAVTALGGYSALARVERVVVLEEKPGRVWEPLADAALGALARVGTGGLALEMTWGRLPDPELPGPPLPAPLLLPPIVVTARREGEAVGGARAWVDRSGAHASVTVVERCRRQGIGSHLLARLEMLARAEGWDFPQLLAEGPCGFYQARSGWAAVNRTPPTRTRPAS